MMPRMIDQRNDSFKIDQKSTYTRRRRTCLVWAGRDDFLASISATLLIDWFLSGIFRRLCLNRFFRNYGSFGVFGQRDYAVFFGESCEDDTHGVSTLGRYFGHGRAYHLAAGKNHQDLVLFVDDQRPGEFSALLLQLRHLDAESAAALNAVLVDRGALGVPAFGDDEYESGFRNDRRVEQVVVFSELHTDYTRGRTAHRAQRLVRRCEANRHALLRHEKNIRIFLDQEGRDELVVFAQIDSNDAARAVGVVLAQSRLLQQALAGGQHQVGRRLVVTNIENLSDLLIGGEREQVGHVLTLGVAAGLL